MLEYWRVKEISVSLSWAKQTNIPTQASSSGDLLNITSFVPRDRKCQRTNDLDQKEAVYPTFGRSLRQVAEIGTIMEQAHQDPRVLSSGLALWRSTHL